MIRYLTVTEIFYIFLMVIVLTVAILFAIFRFIRKMRNKSSSPDVTALGKEKVDEMMDLFHESLEMVFYREFYKSYADGYSNGETVILPFDFRGFLSFIVSNKQDSEDYRNRFIMRLYFIFTKEINESIRDLFFLKFTGFNNIIEEGEKVKIRPSNLEYITEWAIHKLFTMYFDMEMELEKARDGIYADPNNVAALEIQKKYNEYNTYARKVIMQKLNTFYGIYDTNGTTPTKLMNEDYYSAIAKETQK